MGQRRQKRATRSPSVWGYLTFFGIVVVAVAVVIFIAVIAVVAAAANLEVTRAWV